MEDPEDLKIDGTSIFANSLVCYFKLINTRLPRLRWLYFQYNQLL